MESQVTAVSSDQISDKNETNASTISDQQLVNFKLLEEKFKKVMQQNADLNDKNQELEHIVVQLQCETETISNNQSLLFLVFYCPNSLSLFSVDYITMYQMEKKKLNQKYKEKDESIRSLSTQLQVNKLALLEINTYLTAFMKLQESSEEKKTETIEAGNVSEEAKTDNLATGDQDAIENSATSEDDDSKKQHLLLQMGKILAQLTTNSSNTLNTITNSIIEQKKRHLPQSPTAHANSAVDSKIDQVQRSAVTAFRSDLVLCSSCYGDLFIVWVRFFYF